MYCLEIISVCRLEIKRISFTNCLDVSRESRMMRRDQRGILSLFFDDQRLSVLTSLTFLYFHDISWSISEYTYVVYSSVLTQCRSFFIPVANKHFLTSVFFDLSAVQCEMLNFVSFQTSRLTFYVNVNVQKLEVQVLQYYMQLTNDEELYNLSRIQKIAVSSNWKECLFFFF